ncbi:MAG TPA: hypothetical protein DDY37_03570 [Legionella sp.]|nr:hypothetical protein [Legionella sp.]
MMFFDENRAFFTPYESPEEFGTDLVYVITDPLTSLCNFALHFSQFLLCSIPLTLGLMSFNIPLFVLLSLPLALSFLTFTAPLIIALVGLAFVAAPAVISFSYALYDVVDLVLSPIVDILRIITNLGATLTELLPTEMPSVFCS